MGNLLMDILIRKKNQKMDCGFIKIIMKWKLKRKKNFKIRK